MISVSLFSTLWSLLILHPFHLSVTQMEYKEETKAIQIASKVFLDDLEVAFNDHYGTDVDLWDLREDAKTDVMIGELFAHHLKVQVNGKDTELFYLGKEMDLDANWAYFEIYKVRKIKDLKIRFTLALEQFDDQVNLINMKYQDQRESVRIDGSQPEDTMTFDN